MVIKGEEGVREAYQDERLAQGYVGERFLEPLGALLHDRQKQALLRLLARHRPDRILEIAPGPARLTIELPSNPEHPGILIDSSRQMLDVARGRLESAAPGGWRYVQGDVFRLPIRSQFDLVYSFRLIRHFEESERARIYSEIARVLRPGGFLVFDAVNIAVSAPLRRESPDAYPVFDALLTETQLRAELGQNGFEPVLLEGVQYDFRRLSRLQVLVSPRSRVLSRLLMELVDRARRNEPLEWIVVCRRA